MDLRQPTPLYDALAAALTPLSTGGQVPLNDAVWAATQVVAKEQEADTARILRLRELVASLTAQIAHQKSTAESLLTSVNIQLDLAKQAAADARAAQAQVAEGQADRLAALEKVYVMASARWGFEGGPACIGAALEAVDVR